jgi:hypothetical protein
VIDRLPTLRSSASQRAALASRADAEVTSRADAEVTSRADALVTSCADGG